MAFQLGSVHGDYDFIDIESSSPLGIAYRVRNRKLNRFELLRVLSRTDDEAGERSERFLREASVHARLNHPNVVTFYAGCILDGQFVITTELIEGRTLAERLDLGPVPMTHAISYVSQVLSALDRAHEMGIAHRDIRPGNLILTPDGTVKLTGFTFARSSEDTQVTQFGASTGNVHYVAPEQVQGEQAPDPRCDLYSTGVVLYELLTGRRPFESSSQFEVMLAHVSTPPVPPRDLAPAITPEVEAVVLKAMAKEPAGRFPSAAAFLAALEAVTMRLGAEASPDESMPVQYPFPAVGNAPVRMPAAEVETPVEEAALEEESDTAAVALPEDLMELRFGVREALVLGVGIIVMVASVLLIART